VPGTTQAVPDLVWYVSYGSNMAAERLRCYLEGGCPPGAHATQPGARDPRPPRASIALELPGTVYFAGESPTWGGGVAFYDPHEPGRAMARGYLVSAEQFADIARQEMRRAAPAAGDDPVTAGLADVLAAGRAALGPGRYETLLHLGERASVPMVTVTAPTRQQHLLAAPAPAYRSMLDQGLRETFGWDTTRVERYLTRLPGAA
jgi:hypothetical protein